MSSSEDYRKVCFTGVATYSAHDCTFVFYTPLCKVGVYSDRDVRPSHSLLNEIKRNFNRIFIKCSHCVLHILDFDLNQFGPNWGYHGPISYPLLVLYHWMQLNETYTESLLGTCSHCILLYFRFWSKTKWSYNRCMLSNLWGSGGIKLVGIAHIFSCLNESLWLTVNLRFLYSSSAWLNV